MEKTVIIANMAEAFRRQESQASGSEEGQRMVRENLTLAQRAFFWENDDKLVITPSPIPAQLAQINERILGWSNVQNLYPEQVSLELSSAIAADPALWQRLIEVMRQNRVRLTSYAITNELVALLDKLKQAGVDFIHNENTTDVALVDYLGSKVGFREVCEKLLRSNPALVIPEGYICETQKVAIGRADWFLSQGKLCVVKVSKSGGSGWGTLILTKEHAVSTTHLRQYLATVFKSDTIWQDEQLVVEEFIEPDLTVSGGSPSVEVFVSDSGPVLPYLCEQLITPEGKFLGVGIGYEAVPPWLVTKLETSTKIIGKQYFVMGYRGFFDVDFVLSRRGIPYAVETNVRRTGGDHIYDIGRNLWGEDQSTWGYLLSEDSFAYEGNVQTVEKILQKTAHLLYPMAGFQEGIIITVICLTDPFLGYVIAAKNKAHALLLQHEFKKLFT